MLRHLNHGQGSTGQVSWQVSQVSEGLLCRREESSKKGLKRRAMPEGNTTAKAELRLHARGQIAASRRSKWCRFWHSSICGVRLAPPPGRPSRTFLRSAEESSLQLTPTTIADIPSTTHTHQQRRLPRLAASPSACQRCQSAGTEHRGVSASTPREAARNLLKTETCQSKRGATTKKGVQTQCFGFRSYQFSPKIVSSSLGMAGQSGFTARSSAAAEGNCPDPARRARLACFHC